MPRAKQPPAQEQPQPVEETEEPVLTEQRQRIGPAIRQLRQQQGLSLSVLARRTGISVSYLSRLEKGRSVPSFTLLSRIGQELGVPIGFFVEAEQDARHVDEQLVEELSHTSPSLEGGFSWDGNETKNNEQQSGLRRMAVIRIKSEICKTLGITSMTLWRYVRARGRDATGCGEPPHSLPVLARKLRDTWAVHAENRSSMYAGCRLKPIPASSSRFRTRSPRTPTLGCPWGLAVR
jgi:transcriptional regulator with XRE-family HTH domain